jgi:CBS domain-containing protein/sporulation protein YlmC with PRC-barrel domain
MAMHPHYGRQRFERRSRHLDAARGLRQSLVSLAGLIGRPIRHTGGDQMGRVADVLVRWDTGEAYPPLAAVVAKVGASRVFVPAARVQTVGQREVVLESARVDLREFSARDGETALADQVLDHQLVDIDGARVVRASDLYLSEVGGVVRLVGVDVGIGSLVRRLGPRRWRSRPTPDAVIDWASVHSFGPGAGRGGVRFTSHRGELNALRPAELADLLEDLGREERHELLELVEPATAADALEEMDEAELHRLLVEAQPGEAAALLARMEPDEAADALRRLNRRDRSSLWEAMSEASRARLDPVLQFPPNMAGGEMTTVLVLARADDTVADVRQRIRTQVEHVADLDAVIVVDDEGRLVDDISLAELFVAEADTTIDRLVGPPWPVVVGADADVREVADRLADSRRLSVVVVDGQDRPVGRILADDVLDAMRSTRRRWDFPRIGPTG